jgi:hypothetical protein
MVQAGDVYLVTLQPGKQALATVLGLGAPPWNPRLRVMLVGAYDCLVEGSPPGDLPGLLAQRYWCVCSFVEDGKWALVRRGISAASGQPSTADCVWATHELFLDDLRQRLGLPRQTYTGAEFRFSTHCRGCGAHLHQGFARCPKCQAIREEFLGLERFVADRVGSCCLSGALSDVRDSDGRYYWAPYFIDRVRAGLSSGVPEAVFYEPPEVKPR